jgi:hypothetical protein
MRLDERMKTLRDAQQEMDNRRPAMLAKRKPAASSAKSLADDQNEYVLDASLRSALPPKE